jgi:hypothetical protein
MDDKDKACLSQAGTKFKEKGKSKKEKVKS